MGMTGSPDPVSQNLLDQFKLSYCTDSQTQIPWCLVAAFPLKLEHFVIHKAGHLATTPEANWFMCRDEEAKAWPERAVPASEPHSGSPSSVRDPTGFRLFPRVFTHYAPKKILSQNPSSSHQHLSKSGHHTPYRSSPAPFTLFFS